MGNPMVSAILGSLVRWALAFVGGYLVSKGVWTQDQSAEYSEYLVAAITAAIVSLAWSVYQKYRTRIVVQTALDMPKGSSERQLAATLNPPHRRRWWER